MTLCKLLFDPDKHAKYCDQHVYMSVCLLFVRLSVCLSARISLKPHVHISPTFLYMLPPAVAGSFCDGNAIYYVLPVLWMTLCFYIMERIGQNQRRLVCFVHFARWRHKTTFIYNVVWSRLPCGGTERKSAVFDCILFLLLCCLDDTGCYSAPTLCHSHSHCSITGLSPRSLFVTSASVPSRSESASLAGTSVMSATYNSIKEQV